MSAYRDIKRAARRDLHDSAKVPAYYYRTASSPTPLLVHVRVQAAFNRIGNVSGARIYPAEMQNETPKIRFDLDEIPVDSTGLAATSALKPERGAIVSVEAGEAYQIDNLLDPDDQFQSAEVTRLTATAATGLLVPAA